MTIRAAHTGDLKAIMAVLEAAKGIMRADGNAGRKSLEEADRGSV